MCVCVCVCVCLLRVHARAHSMRAYLSRNYVQLHAYLFVILRGNLHAYRKALNHMVVHNTVYSSRPTLRLKDIQRKTFRTGGLYKRYRLTLRFECSEDLL